MGTLMTFLEHLDELSKVLTKVFGAVFANFVFFFTFGFTTSKIWGYSVIHPYPTLEDSFSALIFKTMWRSLIPGEVDGMEIVPYANFAGGIMTLVYMSLFLAITFSMPLILWEFGKFLSPALKPKERKTIITTIIPATFLFVLGCLFAYLIIIPFTVNFLLDVIVGLDAKALITVDSFMKFVILFILAFGFVFELPIIMYGISKLGVVDSKFWKDNWRYAFIFFIIFGGVITPDGSGITQLMIAIPMLGLYFIGYGAVYLQERKHLKDKTRDKKDGSR